MKRQKKKSIGATEQNEDEVDTRVEAEITDGIPYDEDYHDSMKAESYKSYKKNQFVKICPQSRLLLLIMRRTIPRMPSHIQVVSNWRKQQYID